MKTREMLFTQILISFIIDRSEIDDTGDLLRELRDRVARQQQANNATSTTHPITSQIITAGGTYRITDDLYFFIT